jgi:hypothetical protein
MINDRNLAGLAGQGWSIPNFRGQGGGFGSTE